MKQSGRLRNRGSLEVITARNSIFQPGFRIFRKPGMQSWSALPQSCHGVSILNGFRRRRGVPLAGSSWGTEPFGIEAILGFLLSMEWFEARPVVLILAVRDIR